MKTIPSVRRGMPEDSRDYEKLEIDGVIVYAHQSLQDFEQLEIGVQSGLLGSKLVLRGVASGGGGCCG